MGSIPILRAIYVLLLRGEMATQLALNQSFFQVRVLAGQPILSGNGLVWFRTLGLGPRDIRGFKSSLPDH